MYRLEFYSIQSVLDRLIFDSSSLDLPLRACKRFSLFLRMFLCRCYCNTFLLPAFRLRVVVFQLLMSSLTNCRRLMRVDTSLCQCSDIVRVYFHHMLGYTGPIRYLEFVICISFSQTQFLLVSTLLSSPNPALTVKV